tara:strand:+ start:1879 stop:2355 length:477 start_codon:yes stop_codon:yes gene_type:complete
MCKPKQSNKPTLRPRIEILDELIEMVRARRDAAEEEIDRLHYKLAELEVERNFLDKSDLSGERPLQVARAALQTETERLHNALKGKLHDLPSGVSARMADWSTFSLVKVIQGIKGEYPGAKISDAKLLAEKVMREKFGTTVSHDITDMVRLQGPDAQV